MSFIAGSYEFLLGFMIVLMMALVGHLAGGIAGRVLAWGYFKIEAMVKT